MRDGTYRIVNRRVVFQFDPALRDLTIIDRYLSEYVISESGVNIITSRIKGIETLEFVNHKFYSERKYPGIIEMLSREHTPDNLYINWIISKKSTNKIYLAVMMTNLEVEEIERVVREYLLTRSNEEIISMLKASMIKKVSKKQDILG